MYINLVTHGQFKEAMPKGFKRKQVIYATKIEDILGYLAQFPELKELLTTASYELRLGYTLKDSRSLSVDEIAGSGEFIEGATLHLCPLIGGHEITTAMLITALISAAASIAATILISMFFPMNTDEHEDKKGAIYQGGLVVQKENEPLYYIAGLDVGCGGNLIEGDVFYVNGADLNGMSSKEKVFNNLIIKAQEGFKKITEAFDDDEVEGEKGGGKTISNTMVSNASLLALVALGDGPIGGIAGDTEEEKEKNIYIANKPVRDHGTNALTVQGIGWDERIGEEGQAVMKLVPGITNNVDANIDLPKTLSSGGSQFYHTVTINNLKADKARVRLMVKALVDTNNKKGNQKKTTIAWGIDVKRQSSAIWEAAGNYSYNGKSSQPIVLERVINAPNQAQQDENDRWQFRIYRITADSTTDKLQNDTAFNGHVEIQSIDLPYDGSDTSAPTALFGIAIDLEQFNQGGNYPEVMVRARGRKVRVPTNYDPIARTYTGVWNGAWKTAATQNPVWHWFHIATDQKQGLGFPDDYFLKWELYEIAKFNDESVNGRPRYTLNTQFRSAKDAWPFLVELATTFRAFPYYDGSIVRLVQDRPNQPVVHYVNNTQVANGFFNWQNTELSKQFNEVLVNWYDPDDFFHQKTVRYRDNDSITRNRNAGLAAGGIIRGTFDKIGCTNKQEAYDYARMLCYVSQHENETVSFDTLLGAAGYQPGQLIEIDDVIQSHKQFTGRVAAADENGFHLDYPWMQKANKSYTVHAVVNNQLVLRAVPVVFEDTTVSFVECDATGMDYGTPFGIVEAGGAQPRVCRITNIEDKGDGLYTVTCTSHVEGKYAWVEQDVPVPVIPYSDLKRNSAIPAPTGLAVKHTFSVDDAGISHHTLTLSWDAITDPSLAFKGYKVEVFKPDGLWHDLYSGLMNSAAVEDARAGEYIFTVKPINTFGASGDPAVLEYELEHGTGAYEVLPPIFVGFD